MNFSFKEMNIYQKAVLIIGSIILLFVIFSIPYDSYNPRGILYRAGANLLIVISSLVPIILLYLVAGNIGRKDK